MAPNPDDSNFSKVYQQAAKIISSLTGTIILFTLIGYGVEHFYPSHNRMLFGFVILGIIFGFAVMIKEVVSMSDQ
ncbi:hypothetical protein EBR96_03835 [bacterium]|nr:hypothetical protein [bacterium]